MVNASHAKQKCHKGSDKNSLRPPPPLTKRGRRPQPVAAGRLRSPKTPYCLGHREAGEEGTYMTWLFGRERPASLVEGTSSQTAR
ncbi:hypothetical protein KPB2_5509 [Klebsiella pneumoniae Kb677]|nr:hypothetical protein KPB2_5509 [Klebsiella pneumoniae Kb677]